MENDKKKIKNKAETTSREDKRRPKQIRMQKHLGERLRQARVEANFDQKTVAERLLADQSKISLMEKGERKVDAAEELPFLAVLYNKPISWFLNYRDIVELEEKYFFDSLIDEVYGGKLELTKRDKFQIRRSLKEFVEHQVKLVRAIKIENNIIPRPKVWSERFRTDENGHMVEHLGSIETYEDGFDPEEE